MSNSAFYHKLVAPTCNEVIFAHFQNPDEAKAFGIKCTGTNIGDIDIIYAWNRVEIQAIPTSSSSAQLCVRVPFNQNVSGFERLIGALSVSKGSCCGVSASVEGKNTVLLEGLNSTGSRQEIDIDISHIAEQGQIVNSFEVNISSLKESPLILSIYWLGFSRENAWKWSDALRMGSQDYFYTECIDFEKHHFVRGLLFDKSALDDVRRKLEHPAWAQLYSHMEEFAKKSMQYDPVAEHYPYIPGYDERFVREREKGREPLYWAALNLAFVGLVNRDASMIRHVQLYILCMLDAPQWFSSAEEMIPTSSWNARAFLPEMTCTTLAILWDWLGNTFKPPLTKALMRAIWARGMSPCQGDLMAFPYMREMNQGAIFCRPLVLGGLMLEKHWNMGNYVDDWYETMSGVVNKVLQQGGGAQEGPTYLTQFSHGALWGIIAWNRARNKNWQRQVKLSFSGITDYLETVSQNTSNTYTPLGDSRTDIGGGDIIPVLAGIIKKDCFLHACAESCVTSGAAFVSSGTLKNSGGFLSLVYGPERFYEDKGYTRKSVIVHKKSKKLRYTTTIKNKEVSILLNGKNSGLSHSHEDAGSFVIDVDDMPVICDPGMVAYENIETVLLKKAEYHNVLFPLNEKGKYVSSQKLGYGNSGLKHNNGKKVFTASVALDGVWKELPRYSRTISAPVDNQVNIYDCGVAEQPGKFAFSFVTPFTVLEEDELLIVDFNQGRLKIDADWHVSKHFLTGLKDFKGREITAVHLISKKVVSIDFLTNITFEF